MKHSFTLGLFFLGLFLIPAISGFGQEDQRWVMEGNATWYRTSSTQLNASHARLPFGTRLRITNLENNKVVFVSVNNRISDDPNRIIDVSEEAAKMLELKQSGSTRVLVEMVTGNDTGGTVARAPATPPAAPPAAPPPPPAAPPPPPPPPAPEAVPEITAVPVVEAEPPPPPEPQPPARTAPPPPPPPPAAPPPPPPPAPPTAVAAAPERSDAVSIRMIVTVNGKQHIVDFPDVAGLPPHVVAAPQIVTPPMVVAPVPPSPAPSVVIVTPMAPMQPSVVHPASRPPAKIVPGMPDPNGRGIYRVQVGAFSNTNFAQDSYNRLRAAGFSPAFEQYGNVYRVVISGIRAIDMPLVAQRLGNAGFAEAWIRQEN